MKIRTILVVTFLSTLLTGCDLFFPKPLSVAKFSPAAGTYINPQYITVQLPRGATDIKVTTDGVDPTEACDDYDHDASGDISVPVSSVVKVLYMLKGVQHLDTAFYTIESPEPVYTTNQEIAEAWVDYKADLREIFICEFNDCQLPSVAQAAKLLGVTWTVEDGVGGEASWVNYQLGAANTPPSSCGRIGHVYFDYSGYEHDGMIADGKLDGCFKADQSGTFESPIGGEIVISGASYSATIVEETTYTHGVLDGGGFVVDCDDAGCADGPIIVLAPDFSISNDSMPNPEAMSCN